MPYLCMCASAAQLAFSCVADINKLLRIEISNTMSDNDISNTKSGDDISTIVLGHRIVPYHDLNH